MPGYVAVINDLKLKLNQLGYHNDQIKKIIREVIDTTPLDRITPEQNRMLVETLEGYLSFAGKCWRINRVNG